MTLDEVFDLWFRHAGSPESRAADAKFVAESSPAEIAATAAHQLLTPLAMHAKFEESTKLARESVKYHIAHDALHRCRSAGDDVRDAPAFSRHYRAIVNDTEAFRACWMRACQKEEAHLSGEELTWTAHRPDDYFLALVDARRRFSNVLTEHDRRMRATLSDEARREYDKLREADTAYWDARDAETRADLMCADVIPSWALDVVLPGPEAA